jgi:hypothetical protein
MVAPRGSCRCDPGCLVFGTCMVNRDVHRGYIPWASGTRRNAIYALGPGAIRWYDEKNAGPTRDMDEDPVGFRDF